MISIFLCDDEPFWIEQLEKSVSNYKIESDWEIELACKATSPQELLDYMQAHKSLNGLYFLDINFKSGMNGLALAVEIRKLDPQATFVFVTTKEELVMETFRLKLGALDYIIKDHPNLIESIHSCLAHLEERFVEDHAGYKDSITIRLPNSYKTIALKDIYYIDTSNSSHRLTIHATNEIISYYSSLASIQDKLSDNFQRCNKNCIVNLHQVKEFCRQDKKIILNNDEICECSIREWRRILKVLKEEKNDLLRPSSP